jgi:hypothetical protein
LRALGFTKPPFIISGKDGMAFGIACNPLAPAGTVSSGFKAKIGL